MLMTFRSRITALATACLLFLTTLFYIQIPHAAASEKNALLTFKGKGSLEASLIARYNSGATFAEGGTEIVVYNEKYNQLYSVNGAEKALDIVSLLPLNNKSSFQDLSLTKRISLQQLNNQTSQLNLKLDDITSVAVHPSFEFVAVAAPASPVTDAGYIIFLGHDGTYLSHVQVGVLPDMVTFTPDGKYALAANEGQPNDDYSIDPEGSVSIIDVTGDIAFLSANHVTTAQFDKLDTSHIRKVKPEATFAQDAEPEYIVVSEDSKKAFVVLQENNAIATLNLQTKQFESIHSLGTIDHSLPGFALDASDKDGVASLKNWPTLGLFMPDGMSLYTANGKTYILTANEGDAKDYDGFSEEARVVDIADRIALDAKYYKGYTQEQLNALQAALTDEKQLGRLKTTTSVELNADGKQPFIHSYGTRSFSIWDADTMKLVFDSGDQFERITNLANPHAFNTNNEANEFDTRSDDKGVEPEAVVVGQVGNKPYAFIGLERAGGIMAYDITNPANPAFDIYFSSRSYDLNEEQPSGDVAPEGLTFIDEKSSPTGRALLVVANELSGTIAVYELTPSTKKMIQIIATNDIHSRVVEGDGMGYAKIAAIVEQYKKQNPNTIVLDAGDTLHGQTYSTLVNGESIIELMNEIGYDAMTTGNHDYNYGYKHLKALSADASFPILAANVVDAAGQYVYEPYVIKEVAGIKLGIFGIATPETIYKTHPKNVEGISFTDPEAAIKEMVDTLKPQADVIINLAHLGTDGSTIDANRTDYVTSKIDGVDLVIDGHSHEVVNKMINDTLLVQFGEYGKQVGVITLVFENDKLIDKTVHSISVDDAKTLKADASIEAIIKQTSASQDVILNEVIANTDVKLEGERAVVRTSESNLGNLITNAMLEASGANIALTNGGGIRASIDKGNITIGDVITVLPFGNIIVTIEVTGQELKDALEVGAAGYPAAHGAFAHVAGISYTINASNEAGNRIENIKVNGLALNLNKTYTLATNDFLAAGGDGYTMFADNTIINHASSLDEALIAYIKKNGTSNVVVGERIAVTKGKPTAALPNDSHIEAPSPAEGYYIVKKGDTLYGIAKKHNTSWRELQKINNIRFAHLIYPGQTIKLAN